MPYVVDKPAESLKDSEIGVVTCDVRRILLPTDGSSTALEAMDVAIGMAKRFGAEIVSVFVDPDPASKTDGQQALSDLASSVPSSRAGVEVAKRAGVKNGVDVSGVFKQGPIVTGIVEAAHDCHCDLIVIGDTGRTGYKRTVLGSVAEAVLHTARVPVLVVKHSSAGHCIMKRP